MTDTMQKTFEATVLWTDVMNPTYEAEGGTVKHVREKPWETFAAKILGDRIATACQEALVGRRTVARKKDGTPRKNARGETVYETRGGVYLAQANARTALREAFKEDPDCLRQSTEKAKAELEALNAFVTATEALQLDAIEVYIAAAAGTETKWVPYYERIRTPEAPASTKSPEERAAAAAAIEALLKAA